MRVPHRGHGSAQQAPGGPPELAEPLAVLGLLPGTSAGLIEIAYRCQIERLAREAGAGVASPGQRRRLDQAVAALREAIDLEGAREPLGTRRVSSDPYELLHLDRQAGQELIAAAYTYALRSALAAEDVEGAAALEWAYGQIGAAEARNAYDRLHPPNSKRKRRSAAAPARNEPAPCRERDARAPSGVGRLRRMLGSLTNRRAKPVLPLPEQAKDARGPDSAPVVARPVRALSISLAGETLETVEIRDGAAYIIGSAVHCDIPLVPPRLEAGGTVAAEHARVAAGVGGVSFRQIAEHAETFVNGKPARWMLLEPGDELWIGPYRCRYEIARYEVDRWRVAAWS